MLRIASLTLVGGAVLLMTWVLAPAATRPQRVAAPGASVRDQAAASTDFADFQREIERLRARLGARPDYPSPVRDPFRFGRGPAASRQEAPAAVVAPPPAPAPVLPRLVAILSDTVDGVVVRRAALALDGAVRLVAVGDAVGALRLRAITPDGIELTDPVTSATFRLTLR